MYHGTDVSPSLQVTMTSEFWTIRHDKNTFQWSTLKLKGIELRFKLLIFFYSILLLWLLHSCILIVNIGGEYFTVKQSLFIKNIWYCTFDIKTPLTLSWAGRMPVEWHGVGGWVGIIWKGIEYLQDPLPHVLKQGARDSDHFDPHFQQRVNVF